MKTVIIAALAASAYGAAVTTTSVDWADWEASKSSTTTTTTTTTKPIVKATTTTAGCSASMSVSGTKTITTWVGADCTAWNDWASSSSTTTTTKPVVKSTTTTDAWVDPTWSDWVSSSTTLKTTTKAPTTTVAPTSTWGDKPSSSSSSAATTTTKAPVAAPTCSADNGKNVLIGGSCGCEFTVNCGVHASPDAANTSFWEKTSGGIVPTLGECLALCDNNDKCEVALWVDDASSGDSHHCWQVSGAIGPAIQGGVAQISYKGKCSGKCSSSYAKQ